MSTASVAEKQTCALPAVPPSVGKARTWLVAVATGLVSEERLSSLALVVSEIVTNAVLSGYSGRLNQEIRIKRGLSYGAGSGLDARRDVGPFVATAQTNERG